MTIIGFRYWDVEDGKLYSTWASGFWTSGKLTASHVSTFAIRITDGMRYTGHVAPADDCQCGFYAFKYPLVMCACDDPTDSRHGAVGVVKLSGRICVHETGFRAQHAEVAALVDFTGTVSSEYGVPVYPDLDTMWSEWAPDTVEREHVAPGRVWCDSMFSFTPFPQLPPPIPDTSSVFFLGEADSITFYGISIPSGPSPKNAAAAAGIIVGACDIPPWLIDPDVPTPPAEIAAQAHRARSVHRDDRPRHQSPYGPKPRGRRAR
jgi:hypothetical protein